MKHISKLMGLALALCLSVPAHAAPFLSMTPAPATVNSGEGFSIAVNVNDISDLYGYNLSLTYDPSKVAFLSVSEGDFMTSVNTTFFIPGVDDGVGTVAFSGAAFFGPIAGASGGGRLLDFTFKAIGGGIASFGFADLLFIDSGFGELAVGAGGTRVTIVPGAVPVPEPATSLLLVGALALLAQRTRRQRRGGGAR